MGYKNKRDKDLNFLLVIFLLSLISAVVVFLYKLNIFIKENWVNILLVLLLVAVAIIFVILVFLRIKEKINKKRDLLQNPAEQERVFNLAIAEKKWEEAESLLIGFPNLLTPKILYLFLKKGLNLKNILKSYKKHTTENTLQSFEFNMFIDALAGYGFSEEKYKKHISSDAYPTEDFGDPTNEIEIFFRILFGLFELELRKREEMPTGPKGDIEAMRIDWVSDKNFSIVKEVITVLCNHQAVPKELIESLKNVVQNIKDDEKKKNEILELFKNKTQ